MFLYRVEHRNTGIGPYHTSSDDRELQRMKRAHNSSRAHPTPYRDNLGHRTTVFDFYAFKTIEALKYWFKGFLRTLKRLGFVIVRLNVNKEHVSFGKKQVAFRYGYVRTRYEWPQLGRLDTIYRASA